MKLSTKNLYYVLVGTICLGLIALLLGAYGANSFLKGKSKTVREARLENLVLEEKQKQLTKARADIDKYQTLAEIAQHIVPQDKDQAQTVREIVNIAAEHGLKLGSISFPTSSLGDPKTQYSQLKPVTNIPGVLSLEITVTSDGTSPATYDSFISFLDSLEHNRRTALVTGFTLTPSQSNPNRLAFTLTLKEYVKP